MNDDDDEANEDNETRALFQRLNSYLKNFGLTPFSSSVAIEYLRSQLKKEGGSEKMSRVLGWLLRQLNGGSQTNRVETKVTCPDEKDKDHSAPVPPPTVKPPPGAPPMTSLRPPDPMKHSNKDNIQHSTKSLPQRNWQAGCPNIIPGLHAQPIWNPSDMDIFPWVPELEALAEDIRQELISLRGKEAFQPYRSPPPISQKRVSSTVGTSSKTCADMSDFIQKDTEDVGKSTTSTTTAIIPNTIDKYGQLATDSGQWNVSYLYLHGISFDKNTEKCPITMNTIENIISKHYSHALFSALAPNTHVTPHYGPTNKKLRCHLPLYVDNNDDKGDFPLRTCGRCSALATDTDDTTAPRTVDSTCPCRRKCAWLRVADKTIEIKQNKCVIFDDSFEHEAYNGT